MPSSFTPTYNLEKPADGEQDGSWGDTVNANADKIDAAIAAEATSRTSGDAALTSAISSEAGTRAAADGSLTSAINAEISNRAQAVSNEAAARSSADAAIYGWGPANFCLRQNFANSATVNFQPGDGFDVPLVLSVSGGSQGGYLHMTAVANLSATQPGLAYLRLYVNSNQLPTDATTNGMTALGTVYVPPNSGYTIEAHYVTTSGGGQPWAYVGLHFSYIFVAG